ncbi:MAG: T9SS type A sorting domain-containing protein [Flavobacteriales bacterium]|nr:T9SS type A sorting domain-containing protein [Flavobacteriales bacterium]
MFRNSILTLSLFICIINMSTAQMGWRFGVGGSEKEFARDIVEGENGHYYVTGSIGGDANLDPYNTNTLTYGSVANGSEFILAKYDSLGNHIWSYNFSGSSSESEGKSIAYDGNGNIYVVGNVFGPSGGEVDFDPDPVGSATLSHNAIASDVFLAKYNLNGVLQWVQLVASGSGEITASSVVIDSSGFPIVGGDFAGTADFDPTVGLDSKTSNGKKDIFVSKFDSSGNHLWAMQIGSSDDDIVNYLTATSTSFYLYGYFAQSNIDFDPLGSSGITLTAPASLFNGYFGKYEFNGHCEWAYALGGFSEVNDLEVNQSGDVYITGGFFGTVDFDPGSGVQNQMSGGGTSYDAYIAKYSANGSFKWVEAFEGIAGLGNVDANIALDPNSSNLAFAVNFTETVDFGIGTTDSRVAQGSYDIFLMHLDSARNVLQAFQIGGSAVEKINRLHWTKTDSVVMVGDFNGTADFDPCLADTLPSSKEDMFMSTYAFGNCPIPVSAVETPEPLMHDIYPNPIAQGAFLNVRVDEILNMDVVDMSGRVVMTELLRKGLNSIFLEEFNAGLYFIRLSDQKSIISTQKLIVQ